MAIIEPTPSQMWMLLHETEHPEPNYIHHLRDLRDRELNSDDQPDAAIKVTRWDFQIVNNLANWTVTAIQATRKNDLIYQIDLLGIDHALPTESDILLCPILRSPGKQGFLSIDNWGDPTLIQFLEQAQVVRGISNCRSLCGLLL